MKRGLNIMTDFEKELLKSLKMITEAIDENTKSTVELNEYLCKEICGLKAELQEGLQRINRNI